MLLMCEMKAPSDSIVYWSQKKGPNQECKISTQNANMSSLAVTRSCNISAVVCHTTDPIDDTFSLFHLELKVRLSIGQK